MDTNQFDEQWRAQELAKNTQQQKAFFDHNEQSPQDEQNNVESPEDRDRVATEVLQCVEVLLKAGGEVSRRFVRQSGAGSELVHKCRAVLCSASNNRQLVALIVDLVDLFHMDAPKKHYTAEDAQLDDVKRFVLQFAFPLARKLNLLCRVRFGGALGPGTAKDLVRIW